MEINSLYRTGSRTPSLAITPLTQKEKTKRKNQTSKLLGRLTNKRSKTRKLSPLGGPPRETTAESIKMW